MSMKRVCSRASVYCFFGGRSYYTARSRKENALKRLKEAYLLACSSTYGGGPVLARLLSYLSLYPDALGLDSFLILMCLPSVAVHNYDRCSR